MKLLLAGYCCLFTFLDATVYVSVYLRAKSDFCCDYQLHSSWINLSIGNVCVQSAGGPLAMLAFSTFAVCGDNITVIVLCVGMNQRSVERTELNMHLYALFSLCQVSLLRRDLNNCGQHCSSRHIKVVKLRLNTQLWHTTLALHLPAFRSVIMCSTGYQVFVCILLYVLTAMLPPPPPPVPSPAPIASSFVPPSSSF